MLDMAPFLKQNSRLGKHIFATVHYRYEVPINSGQLFSDLEF